MSSSSQTDANLGERVRQQEVVSELGQQALRDDDLDRLFDDATTAVAETLDVEFCSVLELQPGGDQALCRAATGWREHLAESETVPTDRDHWTGHTLQSDAPVVVEDLRTETRFSGSSVAADVVSGIAAVVGPAEDPWGVLGAYAAQRRSFTEYDVGFVEDVADVLAAAVENERTRGPGDRERQLVETSPSGIVVLDETDEIQFANERAAEILGRSRANLHGASFGDDGWDLVDADGHPVEDGQRPFERVLEAGEPTYDVELGLRRPDGDRTWLSVNGRPLPADEPGEAILVLTDVTERKERERELRKSQVRYETIAEHLPNGHIIMFDEDLRYTFAAGRGFDDLPRSGEDLVGNRPRDVFGEDLATTMESIYRATLDGEERSLEREYADQVWRIQVAPIREDDGTIVGGASIVQDVTERRQYQRRIEESERRYRTIAEHFPNGLVIMFDDDCRYTLAAGQAFEDIPMVSEDLVGNSPQDVFGEDLGGDVESVYRAVLDGNPQSLERTLFGRVWRFQVLPIEGDEEHVSAGISIIQDVTERVEREQRLQDLVEKLEESNERLEQFAYAASHDLQEPLRMVSSYLQLIEKRYGDELDEDGREFLDFAVDGADRMREMITGLLEYARVDTRGNPFEPVELDEVLADVEENLQVKIEESDAEIASESLPRVEGDAGQLRQVFQNLLGNAIEYCGDDPPRIHVSATREDDAWEVSVRDEGVGIDPDDADRVFEVFQSLHDRREAAGTGIGLALCERIVERHGGDIWIDSEPGEGTTVSFTLPTAGDDDD